MPKTLFAFSLGFVGLILAAHTGQAAPQCAPRDNVVATLAGQFGETRRGMGIAANNGVVEMFASEKSGSWTITVTMPNGTTCLLATGDAFEATHDTLPAQGAPA